MSEEFDRLQNIQRVLSTVGYRMRQTDTGVRGTWRIAATSFHLSDETQKWLVSLGPVLQKFNIAANQLYRESVEGTRPNWIADYLDQGKPQSLVNFQRMKRLRNELPLVIRPDIIPTPSGCKITELDSCPGGIGLTSALSELYSEQGNSILSEGYTIPEAFIAMIRQLTDKPAPVVAIIVSEESDDYRAEMTSLGETVASRGIDAVTVRPEEVWYSEDGAYVGSSTQRKRIDVIYRFFELFDLPNIPKAEMLMFLVKKGRLQVTPPIRPLFEEKLWFALLHHPMLESDWHRTLGDEGFWYLKDAFPRTWILDPRAVPPHSTIPGLYINGSSVAGFDQLLNVGRGERQLVIKPSGFSPLAWGSRGVAVGHDLNVQDWNEAVQNALDGYSSGPHILQEFHTGSQFQVSFYEEGSGRTIEMQCRARICPYYFVIGDEVKLASVLATLCPIDKKKIHGMPEAVIVPCAK